MVEGCGSIALLAHVYQAGQYFSNLSLGASLLLIYGDDKKVHFTVSQIQEFRSENPADPNTNFIASDGSMISPVDLFIRIYAHPADLHRSRGQHPLGTKIHHCRTGKSLTCHLPAITGEINSPIPSMVTLTTSPVDTGPTPAGVPVRITSPASSVITEVMNEIN